MSKSFVVQNLGNTLFCWLNYILAIERDVILDEGTLKVPIAEYLQTTNISGFQLEYNHPVFARRRIDTLIENKPNSSCFEFKYIKKDSTLKKREMERIFNDLVRLKESKLDGYFLICGKRDHFKSSFQKISKTSPPSKNLSEGFYTEWFDFESNNPKSINLNSTDNTYKEIYDNFLDEYKKSFEDKNKGSSITLPNSLTTTLEYLSPDNYGKTYSISKVAIWKVV